MSEPFGEVGGDVPEYFSSRTHFAKIEDKKVLRKISSKNLTAGVCFFNYLYIGAPRRYILELDPRNIKW